MRRDENEDVTTLRGNTGIGSQREVRYSEVDWDYEGRTDGRRIDWEKLATTGGLYICELKAVREQ